MDEVKKLTDDEFNNIASKLPFNKILVAKDYYITIILYLIKDVEGICFKGGTALQKILLHYARLSEDVDFSLTRDIKEIKDEIIEILDKSRLFGRITKDKDVEGFTRLVVHYRGFSNEEETVFIDLNQRAKLLMKPERHEIRHFYEESIPGFSIKTLALEEMVAEKVMAAIGRNNPRDIYDVYKIIKAGIPVNLKLVKKKCREAGVEFDVIKIFNKAKKLKNRWDEDMMPLLAEETSFESVMKTLARHFKLKEENERRKITKTRRS